MKYGSSTPGEAASRTPSLRTSMAELAAARMDAEGILSEPGGYGNLGYAALVARANFFGYEVPRGPGKPRVSRAALEALALQAMWEVE